jgi:hypothetical protein
MACKLGRGELVTPGSRTLTALFGALSIAFPCPKIGTWGTHDLYKESGQRPSYIDSAQDEAG